MHKEHVICASIFVPRSGADVQGDATKGAAEARMRHTAGLRVDMLRGSSRARARGTTLLDVRAMRQVKQRDREQVSAR